MQSGTECQIPLHQRLTVRLTAGVVLVLLVIGCPFLLAFHRLLRNQQLEYLDEATSRLGLVIIDGLRAAMLSGQPHLFDSVIRNLDDQEGVERLILIDHQGRVRVSSDPAFDGMVLNRDTDSTCRGCHPGDGSVPLSRTAVAREEGQRVFRAMTAIPNEIRCHACHDPGSSINGILLMDLALESADRRFLTGIGSTVALGTVMVLLTVAVLVLLLRRMVHRPLGAVVAKSQRVVQGDLDARATVSSSGEFALLASQVNRMTDHLARSLRTVESQHRELQEILDAVDDEIVVLDRQQRVVAANQAFKTAFGRTPGEITGHSCREGAVSAWACALDQPGGCPVQRVFQTGRLQKGIMSRSGSDGRVRAIEIHASPLRGVDGEVSHAVEVRRDISERRQMEAVLAHSERMASLGLLASGFSHEINNPLAAIGTSVEGLRRRLHRESGILPEDLGTYEEMLMRVAQEVERGRKITTRLLRVARPAAGARTLVDLNHVVEDIVGILSHDIKKSGIVTDLELGRGMPPLCEDESRVSQVIMNLTLNAIQAMAETGGKLRIATGVANGGYRIDVNDSGCGIPPEVLKRIYEPFFTTKPVGKGTGLGLFITHRIVSEMDGTIEVHSRPGEGTRFTVWIPRIPEGTRP